MDMANIYSQSASRKGNLPPYCRWALSKQLKALSTKTVLSQKRNFVSRMQHRSQVLPDFLACRPALQILYLRPQHQL